MPTLAKILRALSVLFMSLGALMIAIPLSIVLGTGMHVNDMPWLGSIYFAITFALVGTVLFWCYRFSRRDKRSSLTTALLWCVVLATGIYGAMFIFSLLHIMVQHW
jgi:uncharacterized BrkB/YihY/UPF0761 family membrane protein